MFLILIMTLLSAWNIHRAVLKNKVNAKYVLFEKGLLLLTSISIIVIYVLDNGVMISTKIDFQITYTYVIIVYLLGASAFNKMQLNIEKQKVENIIRETAIENGLNKE